MHKTVLKIFVLLLNCFVIFGLPFLKPDIGYRQGQNDELGLAADTDENDARYQDTESQSDDFIPRSYYDNAQMWDSNFGNIMEDKHLSENDEDMAVKRAFEDQFFGSRGKRMGFLSSLPSGYRGWYTSYQQRPRKRFHPKMFVSMRGKRLDDTYSRSLANYMDLLDDFHPNKRYHGFTALRGRRSIRS